MCADRKTYTNNISGANNPIQIQQNTKNSSQFISVQHSFDFDKANEIIQYIKSNIEKTPVSSIEQSEIRNIIDDVELLVQKKEDQGYVKKSLYAIKDILIGTAGNIISSGIIHLISQI